MTNRNGDSANQGDALSSTETLDGMSDHGFAVSGRRERDQVFRSAMRHSRRVRLLRRVIPVLIVVILCATAAARWLDPLRVLSRLPATSKGLVISGSKIKMEAPKLSGYTNDARWYELSAESAAQDITKPNLIELNEVRARLEAPDKSTLSLSAVDGNFDRSTGMLQLSRDITMSSSAGLEIHLEEAVINTGTSEVVSSKPVEVKSPQGTIRADRLEVASGGEVISFVGGVVAKLILSNPNAARPVASDKP